MRKAMLLCCAAAVLSACNGTPQARRPGLWAQTLTRDGNSTRLGPMNSIRVCINASRDAANPVFNYAVAVSQAKAKHCQPPVAKRGLDGVYSFSLTCPIPSGNGVTMTKGTASGDFNSHYHLHIERTVTRPPPFTALNSHHIDDIDGAWLGPCPPGMAPGDMVLANGVKLPHGMMQDPHRGLFGSHPRPNPSPPRIAERP